MLNFCSRNSCQIIDFNIPRITCFPNWFSCFPIPTVGNYYDKSKCIDIANKFMQNQPNNDVELYYCN